MSNIDKQALREEFQYMQDHYSDPADRARQVIYIAAEALLDERERNQQYIKRRDQENEDIALTVGKLRVELEAAKKSMTEQSAIVAAAEKLVRCKGRYHSELNYRALAAAPKPQNVPQNIPENIPSGKSTLTPDGWISCSERMPAQDDWVLIYSKHGEYLAGQVQGEYVELNDGTLSWLGSALHWMLLPEPPQQEVK
ncbi:ead/Ea22-like family protein [Salmonella enterica]|nr:ead/Ea22-like family protein [Salmonella enterica]